MKANWSRQWTFSTAQTDLKIFTPGANNRFYITDIIISSAVANTVTLEEDAAADVKMFKFTLGENGGCVINLTTPIAANTDGASLLLTTTGTGQFDITVVGYEE